MASKLTVIAVDGPAASGKGTLARRIAAHYAYAHLDTGLLYRAVARAMLAAGADPADPVAATAAARALVPSALDEAALRTDAVANAAGEVAAHAGVRAALLGFQRGFAARPPGGAPGAVLDGRDIGTVVCLDADAKIFIDADLVVRARRRLKELRERGIPAIWSAVLQDMKARDARDRTRAVAPLAPAADAFVLDTTDLDPDQAFAAALSFIETRNKP